MVLALTDGKLTIKGGALSCECCGGDICHTCPCTPLTVTLVTEDIEHCPCPSFPCNGPPPFPCADWVAEGAGKYEPLDRDWNGNFILTQDATDPCLFCFEGTPTDLKFQVYNNFGCDVRDHALTTGKLWWAVIMDAFVFSVSGFIEPIGAPAAPSAFTIFSRGSVAMTDCETGPAGIVATNALTCQPFTFGETNPCGTSSTQRIMTAGQATLFSECS